MVAVKGLVVGEVVVGASVFEILVVGDAVDVAVLVSTLVGGEALLVW